jgi:hypothetical protein
MSNLNLFSKTVIDKSWGIKTLKLRADHEWKIIKCQILYMFSLSKEQGTEGDEGKILQNQIFQFVKANKNSRNST